MNERIPDPKPEETPSTKEMYRHLTKIFHPDLQGGNKRLMQDLNLAYELAVKKRDQRKLREIYLKHISSIHIVESNKTTEEEKSKRDISGKGFGKKEEDRQEAREKLREELKGRGRVYRLLLQESARRFERTMENDSWLTDEDYFRNFYKKLCEKEGVQPNEFDLMTMLHNEGWISEEEHTKFKNQFFRKK